MVHAKTTTRTCKLVFLESLVIKEGLKSDIKYRYNDFVNINLCPNVGIIFFFRLPCFMFLTHVDCNSFKSVSVSLCSIACLFSSFFNYELQPLQTYRHDSLLFYCCIVCRIIDRLSVENLGL